MRLEDEPRSCSSPKWHLCDRPELCLRARCGFGHVLGAIAGRPDRKASRAALHGKRAITRRRVCLYSSSNGRRTRAKFNGAADSTFTHGRLGTPLRRGPVGLPLAVDLGARAVRILQRLTRRARRRSSSCRPNGGWIPIRSPQGRDDFEEAPRAGPPRLGPAPGSTRRKGRARVGHRVRIESNRCR